jgi:hypothetical protein
MYPFPPHQLLPFQANLWLSARLLPTVARRNDLEPLLSMATPAAGERAYGELDATTIVGSVKAVVARPWRMRGRRCLREGLLAFHFLSLAGHAPLLHFGVIPKSLKSDRPSAHCWVSVGGEIILNAPAQPMHELFVYDGRQSIPIGRLTPAEIVDHA